MYYGPEYISGALLTWAEQRGIEYIQPGKPQQNAYVERYNRTVRYDWLAQSLFERIEDVQESATGTRRLAPLLESAKSGGITKPYRVDVHFLQCKEAPIQPLLNRLSFIKDKTRWGATFRYGDRL